MSTARAVVEGILLSSYLTIHLHQGATFDATISWEDDAGDPIDITGYTAALRIGTATGVDFTLTDGDGLELTAASGIIVATITAAQTDALTWIRGQYELDVTSSGGDVTRLLRGEVRVHPPVGG